MKPFDPEDRYPKVTQLHLKLQQELLALQERYGIDRPVLVFFHDKDKSELPDDLLGVILPAGAAPTWQDHSILKLASECVGQTMAHLDLQRPIAEPTDSKN